MYDPRWRDPRPPPGMDPFTPSRYGLAAAIPQGMVGCLGGLFVLLLIGIIAGILQGVLLAVGIIALILLPPMIVLAIRRQLREDNRRPSKGLPPLPDDSDLSDEERREAMRRMREDDDAS